MYSMYSLHHGGFKVDLLHDSLGLYKSMFLESKVFYNLASEILKQSNVSCAVLYWITHGNPQFVEEVVYQGYENQGQGSLGKVLESGYHISVVFPFLSFIPPSLHPPHHRPIWYDLYTVEFGKMYAAM